MPTKIYHRANLDTLDWSKIEGREKLEDLLTETVRKGLGEFVSNAPKEMQLLQIGNQLLPLVITDRYQPQTTYLASTLGQYFDLAKEEITLELKGKKSFRALIAPLVLSLMKNIFRVGGFEKVVFVNNYLLSTNLYPALSDAQIRESVEVLKQNFSGHAIVFRSVNEATDPALLKGLLDAKAKKIISRPILMLYPQDKNYLKKRMFKADEKLWAKQQKYHWTANDSLTEDEIKRLCELYEALYRDKYSSFNPSYTPKMLKIWLSSQFMEFNILRNESEEIVGVTAFFKKNGVLTTPFIGYDQKSETSEGLYRFLNLRLMQEAITENLTLNMSSGAAHFKRLRGGETALEYNVVFYHHLPFYRQLPWRAYHQISDKIAIPAIQKYAL